MSCVDSGPTSINAADIERWQAQIEDIRKWIPIGKGETYGPTRTHASTAEEAHGEAQAQGLDEAEAQEGDRHEDADCQAAAVGL